ncbi:MAG: 1-deoxy-D-xylulose-5-phosphate synthase [Candidatus Moranbacteria bacterium CG23_combo_of_CG06-09_8_20_14_all_39_10]|nr:MAG: 1-deoxy-D-xylulose-5-phosphate synthase [Candidatus Moranbacteria bacterium CG23_combo_of_CG06-09_8_20_14_all_39_10]
MTKNRIEKLLDAVNFPADVKKIPAEKLPQLCGEVRKFLIETVSQVGGHFGSNLGVVELTVALHRVFDTPKDLLIWDVGHQAYPHKILTGRKNQLHAIRKKGGLAPFPKREESEYDALSVGHSSTSISAATGMALANKNKKPSPQVVAVIGDGALTGGMAFEALNHAGDAEADMLVILNDNKMSISPNVGGMGKYLTRLISSPAYVRLRSKGREMLKDMPTIQDFLRRAETYTKGMIAPGTLFEELGFQYFGPIDGHDVQLLVTVLTNLKNVRGPKILHVITKKGKGYAPAEQDEFSLHAVKPSDFIAGKKKEKTKLTYMQVFSDWIVATAKKDVRLHSITPAMCEGSGLIEFSHKFPERYHDVGIAEQHAVTFAAGLACAGEKPVVAIYSSFLQRAYDQFIHDIAYQNLDVLFAIDRAGIVGPDGATHAGSFDLSFMRIVPNLVIMAPASENECYGMLEAGYKHKGPAAVRYPRGGGNGEYDERKKEIIEIGKAKIIREGQDIAILSFGAVLDSCRQAAEKLNASLVNMRFVKPLDEEMLRKLAQAHKYFVTVEDNAIAGGAGSAVNEFVLNNNLNVKVKNLGLSDRFSQHGLREEILALEGLDDDSILKSIEKFVNFK